MYDCNVDFGVMDEKVNDSGRSVRRMADPTLPSRIITCGGCDDVVDDDDDCFLE